jgi:hypothetical protein
MKVGKHPLNVSAIPSLSPLTREGLRLVTRHAHLSPPNTALKLRRRRSPNGEREATPPS